MRCLWKEIHRLNFLRKITEVFQNSEVAGEGGGVAGDIDDALRLHIGEGAKDGFGAAGTRRVDDDDIGANPLLVERRHDSGRVAHDELGILYMVVTCIFPCVEDGGLYDFDSVDLSRSLSKKQRNCSCAAIGVDDSLCPMQVGIGECLLVKAFCLPRIDLKEGARGDVEVQSSQRIDDGRSSPEQLCVASHDDVVAIGLDILMDADEVWQTLAHHADELLCAWELLRCGDNDCHEIVAAADTSDDVAQNPLVCVLVIDRDVEMLCDCTHSICKVVVLRTLDVAVFRIDNPVAALCKAADYDLSAISSNRKLHLVPIVPRFFCTQRFHHGNLRELADMGQCVYDLCAFCT